MISGDYTDEYKGYRRFVDSTSLANWYIATEVSANVDGFYSTYFYKDQNVRCCIGDLCGTTILPTTTITEPIVEGVTPHDS